MVEKKEKVVPEKLYPILPGSGFPQSSKQELDDTNILEFMNGVINHSFQGENPKKYCMETYHLVYDKVGNYYTLPGGKLKMMFLGGKFKELIE